MTALKAMDQSPNRETAPAGLQPAVCYAVIDLGQQPGFEEGDPPRYRVAYMFELETRLTTGEYAGSRHGLSKIQTNSVFHRSGQSQMMLAWLGEELQAGADLEALAVGKAATLNVVHKRRKDGTGIVAVIQSVLPPVPDKAKMTPENGKTNPNWRYPRWIREMRRNAIQPPGDLGCIHDHPLEADGPGSSGDRESFDPAELDKEV